MKRIIAGGLLLLAAPAEAEDPALRSLCSDRPSLGVSPCTVDKGHLEADIGLGDYALDKQADSRTDTISAGEVSLRYGVADETELRLAWTAYGHVRERDRITGAIDRTSGIGDVTLGLRQNLARPATGQPGLSYGLLPFVTLPSGHDKVGAGDWGAGLIVPVNYKLDDMFSFNLTPEIDAAVDEDGNGRHFAYGSVVGLTAKLAEAVHMTTEVQATRDRDPSRHVTMTRASLSFAYLVRKMTQLDIQSVAGLNRNTPDFALSFGISHKF